LILSWAIHRIGGACLMLQPTSSAEEIAGHLARAPPFAMVVSQDLLPLGQEALGRSSLSAELPFYRLTVPDHTAAVEPNQDSAAISTLDDLVLAAQGLSPVEKTPLAPGEAARRVAYYCTTSGTSGFQVTSHNPPRII
jgi:long-subunit acyl-CoA synthetase (AMP-forming)